MEDRTDSGVDVFLCKRVLWQILLVFCDQVQTFPLGGILRIGEFAKLFEGHSGPAQNETFLNPTARQDLLLDPFEQFLHRYGCQFHLIASSPCRAVQDGV